ncbi:hypothetical protein ACHAWF_005600, partial [Thalassiosira exigua]
SALARLPSLLAELNGGKAPDLAVLAAIETAKSSVERDGDAAPANPHGETLQSTLDKLFEEHVGKSREVVLGNATRITGDVLGMEGGIWNRRQRSAYSLCDTEEDRQKWLNHPMHPHDCNGPDPDGRVFLELFLGEERAEEALDGAVPMNSGNPRDEHEKETEAIVFQSLKDEAPKLSTVELLANALLYLRKEAGKLTAQELLRFTVLYGLDGAMIDVLRGGRRMILR